METRTGTQRTTCAHSAHESEGSCGHHSVATATALLSDEHRVIERVLEAIDKMTRRTASDSIPAWKKALEFIRGFADQCHHFKEENVLFPALEAHGIPRDGGPVGMMLIEHEEGRALVRGMAAALARVESGDRAAEGALFENARHYLRLLREHIQKEDEILFQMANEVIPADEQRQLLGSFETHEAEEMGAGAHEHYLKIARELENAQ